MDDYQWCLKFQEEDGPSGEDGEGEGDLVDEPDQDKFWEEVDKGLTALHGKFICFAINFFLQFFCLTMLSDNEWTEWNLSLKLHVHLFFLLGELTTDTETADGIEEKETAKSKNEGQEKEKDLKKSNENHNNNDVDEVRLYEYIIILFLLDLSFQLLSGASL